VESLLLVGYSAVFVALVLYVWYLRNRLTTLERKVGDLEN
jgi:CcmD family protein